MPILTKQWIKDFSIYPKNYDLTGLMNFVNSTEMLFVKPLLGEELYDEICGQVEAGQVSPENATLLTDGGLLIYAGQAFALQTLPFAWGHVSQVGVTMGKTENSDSVDMKGITYLTSHLRSNLEEMKKFVFTWLSEHMGSFPKWNPTESFCGCPKPASCCDTGSFVEPQPMKHVYNLPREDNTIK